MSEVRVLLGSLLVGVGGAVLIAALVLGRGDVVGPEWAELAAINGGGVLVIRTEVYQRHGAKADVIAAVFASGDIGVYPERRVDEMWMLFGSQGTVLDMTTVTWKRDGELLQRVRVESGSILTERPSLNVSERRQIGSSMSGATRWLPSDLRALVRTDWEDRLAQAGWELLEPRTPGTMTQADVRQVDRSKLISPVGGSYSVPYYGDLAVREISHEVTVTKDYFPVSEEWWVVLDDGLRVLVESQQFTIEARSTEEWDGFVARVWGE